MTDYMELIRQYIRGKVNLKQLSDFIDERLFDLRQDPGSMTEEQRTLSNIELLICEIKDGYRTVDELEEFAKGLLIIKPEPVTSSWYSLNLRELITASTSNREAEIFITNLPTPALSVDYLLQKQFA